MPGPSTRSFTITPRRSVNEVVHDYIASARTDHRFISTVLIADLRRMADFIDTKNNLIVPDTAAGVLRLVTDTRARIKAKSDERDKIKAIVSAMQGEIGSLEVTMHDAIKAAVAAGTVKVYTTYIVDGRAVSVTPKDKTDDFYVHVTDVVLIN